MFYTRINGFQNIIRANYNTVSGHINSCEALYTWISTDWIFLSRLYSIFCFYFYFCFYFCFCPCFPMRRAEQLDSIWGSRRALSESHGKARCVCLPRSSCAVAPSSQAAQGHPVDKRGVTPGAAFFRLLLVPA